MLKSMFCQAMIVHIQVQSVQGVDAAAMILPLPAELNVGQGKRQPVPVVAVLAEYEVRWLAVAAVVVD